MLYPVLSKEYWNGINNVEICEQGDVRYRGVTVQIKGFVENRFFCRPDSRKTVGRFASLLPENREQKYNKSFSPRSETKP